jgi:hypothetical protein
MTANAPIKIVKRALWRPGWHQLDQPIGVGQFSRFAFFAPEHSSRQSSNLPDQKQAMAGQVDLNQEFAGSPLDFQFFNRTISETQHPLFRFARVLEILHPILGPLERVDTSGLDYVFKPVGGDEIFVNAEEEPGVAYDFDQPVADWSLLVTLDDVSEPLADAIV